MPETRAKPSHPRPPRSTTHYAPGIEALFSGRVPCPRSTRIGLVSHAAAIDGNGASSAERLARDDRFTLTAVMAPEHGFLGAAPAGQPCRSFRHPFWQVPIYSLYGTTRAPKPVWLKKIDLLLIDLQDLGFRPYTYVSTLRLCLEAAAKRGIPAMVADRPIPLPNTVDGPLLDPRFESFVGKIPAPFCYGMTPAETARWLQQTLYPKLRLTTLPMTGVPRSNTYWPRHPWVPPSPSIRCLDTALSFPATVCLEGLPHVDHGRYTHTPFQCIGAPWIRHPDQLAGQLAHLPGVSFLPHLYRPRPEQVLLPGLRMTITDPARFRPTETAIHLLCALTRLYGTRRVWQNAAARPAFLDKLFGTDSVRLAIMDRVPPETIIAAWQPGLAQFQANRAKALLYQ